jgi:hypothetical protein
MAGSYTVSQAGATVVNAVVTLTFVNPTAAPNVDLNFRRFWVGQSQTATPSQQRVQLNTQVTAFPTLVSATPARLVGYGAASVITGGTAGAAGTAGTNASAEGAGTKTVIWQDAFSIPNGWLLVLTDDEQIQMGSGSASGLGMHFPVAVGASPFTLNWVFGCSWQEA